MHSKNGSDTEKRETEKKIAEPVKVPKEVASVKTNPRPDPPKKSKASAPVICYRVQFMLYPKKLSLHSAKFSGLPDVKMYFHQGMFKYTTGEGNSVEEMAKFLEIAKNKGFRDAFIVAFKGEERITIAEAKRLQGMNIGK